jgi:hypothetical protein
MYELTITTGETSITTSHGGRDQARQALLDHAVQADLYLHRDHTPHEDVPEAGEVTVLHLLRLDPAGRQPRCVGTATITAAAAAPTHAPI